MKHTQEQLEFAKASEPLIEWLRKYGNPLDIVIVKKNSATVFKSDTAYLKAK